MIKLYDTRRRQKVDFEPVEPGKVSMYVCGPTVYNRIHIGNARTFISFDMIRRYLSWRGFDVTFVQNVTDVDDKIIRRAAEEARTAAEVAEEVAGQVDGAFTPDADAQEEGEEFGVGQGRCAMGEQTFSRAFVCRPVGDCHGVYNSSF